MNLPQSGIAAPVVFGIIMLYTYFRRGGRRKPLKISGRGADNQSTRGSWRVNDLIRGPGVTEAPILPAGFLLLTAPTRLPPFNAL
jgi:hypothetical protein